MRASTSIGTVPSPVALNDPVENVQTHGDPRNWRMEFRRARYPSVGCRRMFAIYGQCGTVSWIDSLGFPGPPNALSQTAAGSIHESR